MKKALLIALVLVLVLGVLVGGCSSGKTSSTTTTPTSSLTTSTSHETTSTSLETTSTAPTTTSTTIPDITQTVTHQQNDARFIYSGAWKTSAAASASRRSFAFAGSRGASVTIRFIGTHLSWIAKESPVYGKATVILDGKTVATVDLYSKTTVWQHTVWQTATLKSGAHTVTIACTGTKRAAATGTNINVDAIVVTGVVTGRYQESNPKLIYAGTWTPTASTSASGGSFALANTAGASVTIHLTGVYLGWFAKKGPDCGQATVTVDGGAAVTIDLYSAKVAWQQEVWSTGVLAGGTHTVVIGWTGTNINIDAVDVTGTLN
jgi:hypothetical protein